MFQHFFQATSRSSSTSSSCSGSGSKPAALPMDHGNSASEVSDGPGSDIELAEGNETSPQKDWSNSIEPAGETTEQTVGEELVDQWRKHEMAVILTEKEWRALTSGFATGILRGFQSKTTDTLLVLLRREKPESYSAVGILVLGSSVKASVSSRESKKEFQKYLGPLAPKSLDSEDSWIWIMQHVCSFTQPLENLDVRKGQGRIGIPRIFRVPFDSLREQPIAPTRGDLYETAAFFVSKVSPEHQESLLTLGKSLRGRIVRVGTTCSGSDICIPVLAKTLEYLCEARSRC